MSDKYIDYDCTDKIKALEKELAEEKNHRRLEGTIHIKEIRRQESQLQKLKEMYLEVYPALDFTKVLAEKQDDSFYEKHRKFKDELLKQ